MVALYRENILMFVNFENNIVNYINTNCTFRRKDWSTLNSNFTGTSSIDYTM